MIGFDLNDININGAVLVGIGALLAGVGSVLSGIAALKKARQEGAKDAKT